jgi:hypothetical protein
MKSNGQYQQGYKWPLKEEEEKKTPTVSGYFGA